MIKIILAAVGSLTIAACATTPEMKARELAYCERMEREMGVDHTHDHREAKSIGVNPMNVTHNRCRQMLGED